MRILADNVDLRPAGQGRRRRIGQRERRRGARDLGRGRQERVSTPTASASAVWSTPAEREQEQPGRVRSRKAPATTRSGPSASSRTPSEIANAPIALTAAPRHRQVIRVSDVAEVKDTVAEPTTNRPPQR